MKKFCALRSIGLSALLLVCFSSTSFAHDEHPMESAELAAILNLAFTKVNAGQASGDHDTIRLRDGRGNEYFVLRSALTVQLTSALLQLDFIRRAKDGGDAHQHFHPESAMEKAGNKMRTILNVTQWPKQIKRLIQTVPRQGVRIQGAAAEMAAELGIIPVVTILTAYMIYTPITELAEAAASQVVFGNPFGHLYCHVFQAFFWTAVYKVISKIRSLRAGISAVFGEDVNEAKFVDRLKSVASYYLELRRMNRFSRRFELQREGLTVNRGDFFTNTAQQHELIEWHWRQGIAWADVMSRLWRDRLNEHGIEIIDLLTSRALNKSEKLRVIIDLRHSLERLQRLISLKMEADVRESNASLKAYRKARARLGMLSRLIPKLQAVLIISSHQAEESETLKEVNRVYNLLIELMRKFSTTDYSESSLNHLKESILILKSRLANAEAGNVCQDEVAFASEAFGD